LIFGTFCQDSESARTGRIPRLGFRAENERPRTADNSWLPWLDPALPEPDPSEARMHVYARLKRGKSHSLGYVFAILIVLKAGRRGR
jgi:hypothetical protein